ncbi:MAG: hypothetical protein IIB44_06710 [Candidatus Marinimicrobia bacterium]|nr:hypothetical protein [Candidatus Neomarinimicrobiota bacterium]
MHSSLLFGSNRYGNAPSLLVGYVVPPIITTMSISDSLAANTELHTMDYITTWSHQLQQQGSPEFVSILFYARHPLVPRIAPSMLVAVASTGITGFYTIGRSHHYHLTINEA